MHFRHVTWCKKKHTKRVFPEFELRDDSKAKDDWRTAKGGVCYSQGTGGTITGFGAGKFRDSFGGAIIIDDPHKASEARSNTIRKGVIEWFQNTLESRTNSPDTPIIVIMQRLHEEDLAGWLLDGGNGEEWGSILCLSAIQPDGSALWPEKHNIETLEETGVGCARMYCGAISPNAITTCRSVFLSLTVLKLWMHYLQI